MVEYKKTNSYEISTQAQWDKLAADGWRLMASYPTHGMESQTFIFMREDTIENPPPPQRCSSPVFQQGQRRLNS